MLSIVKCPNCKRRLFDKVSNCKFKAEIVDNETGTHLFYIKCGGCKKVVGIKEIF